MSKSSQTQLTDTLDELDQALQDFRTKFSKLTEAQPRLEILPPEQSARTHLTLAFALNSLFYSTLRMSQTDKPAEVKAHPVHAQLKIVRDHYLKLDSVVSNRKINSKEGQGNQVIKRIVERTDRENQRIIKEQNKEAAKAKRKAQSSSSSSSSSSSESESESEEETKVPVATSTHGSKHQLIQGQKKPAQAQTMHGATVVPVPAFIRNRQLLEKLKK